MAEPLPEADLDTAVDPDRITQQKFEIERRGFDQRQVRAYLIAVAESLRDAQRREADMRMRMGRAVRRAETAEQAARALPSTSNDADISRQVGDEVTGVLDAARVAGEQRVAAAESSAQNILTNAKKQASELRGEAETVLAARSADADVAAAKIVAESETQAEQIREKARHDHERARRHAMAMVGKARSESDSLISEAEQARAQILEDMDRRRREARAQVERLRVGRDRLLRSYEVVRRSLDEATGELKISLTEAKVRGDSAARRVMGESPATRPQLEAEVADARMTGLIRIDQSRTDVAKAPAVKAPTPTVPEVAEESPPPVEPSAEASVESATVPGIAVPNIDLRARNAGPSTFSERTAPSPSRPRVGMIEAVDPVARVVPKPPVVAPIIRREVPEVSAEVANDAVDDEQTPTTAEDAAEVVTALLVEAGVDQDSVDSLVDDSEPAETADPAADEAIEAEAVDLDGDADLDIDVVVWTPDADGAPETDADVVEVAELVEVGAGEDVDAEVAELVEVGAGEDELSPEELEAVFAAELPKAELAIVAPADEIEAVVALSPEEPLDEPHTEPLAVDDPDADVEEAADNAGGLFAALREQRTETTSESATVVESDVVVDHQINEPEVALQPEAAAEPEVAAESEAAESESGKTVELVEQDAPEAPAPEDVPVAVAADVDAAKAAPPAHDFDLDEVYRQRDAVIAESASQLERRLKRALADEQNELLAGVRASKKSVALISLVGDCDEHISRYVTAIAEVALTAYSAGMALIEPGAEATGNLPAGAVEELIANSIIDPIRRRLELAGNDEPDIQLSTVRAFYRQRKTDDLPVVAADLASLLCTAGLCDTLPQGVLIAG